MPDKNAARPLHYSLTFEPDFKAFKFAGKMQAQLEVRSKAREIVLNAAELKIKKCWVSVEGRDVPAAFKLDEKKEELTIKTKEKVSGACTLHIDFEGVHNDKMEGFYRSKYRHASRGDKWLVTTQFESADARRAFPCWDEPAAKATFDVTLIVDKGLTAISNMPVMEKKKLGKKIAWRFSTTPVMSTYLLYLGVGEFEFLESRLGEIKIRIAATKGKKKQCALAMDYTKKFLTYYNKFFGIPYPLPKLDMVAIPDFSHGAMENWGAITFRETILLFDPKVSSTATKQTIAEVIAHELAHQWFGNLVTMKWWNDLWLNESFATFMAAKATAELHPEWDIWDQFILESFNEAFSLDALKSSHPIEVDVKSPSQVIEIFDDISYDKGGSVLRMLEHFIGEADFRKGLKSYLTQHKFSNAATEDLWTALSAASKKPVKEMMNTWVRQVGYPVIDATSDGSILTLRQRRFLLEDSAKHSKGVWMIPISLKTPNNVISKIMSREKDTAEAGNSWFKVNYGATGFYRVRYDTGALNKLRRIVGEKKLPNVDRWEIQNDMFALCLSGGYSLKSYLDFARAYFKEDDYITCADAAQSIAYLHLLFSGENFRGEITEYAREYFKNMHARLGWDAKKGEKHTDTLLRGFSIAMMGKLGDEHVLAEAKRRFEAHVKNAEPLSPDLRGAVYSLVAWSGNESTYNRLLELYRKEESQEEKMRFLGALGGFRDSKLLERTLDLSLSKEVRPQDMALPIVRVSGSPLGRQLIWPWLRKSWPAVAKRLGGRGSPLLNRIVGALAAVADLQAEKEIEAYFKKHPVPGTEMKIAQTLERIRINAKLLERARKEF